MNPPSFSSPTDRLSTYFSPLRTQQQDQGRYTDSEIQQISHLLAYLQEPWSRFPRTYIVLRTIGELDLLNQLIDLGFTDHWFPVEPRSLPQSLSPSIRSAFVKAQYVVLTKSIELEKGEHGRHGHFSRDEPLPFEIKGRLGSGGFSQVDRILSLISYKEYALKRTRRRIAFGNDSREAFKRFKAEVDIIKHLKHRHIVEFVGSYTDPSFLGLIMSPVADTDLAKYMKGIADAASAGKAPAEDLANLRSYFGCLSNALQYLHEQSIKHKDIKPQNILIEGGNVLFTDFGLSRNFQDANGSTTSGVTYMSLRYSPPEVIAYDKRNTSADIWSLGCVFLEMTLILKGLPLSFMDEFFDKNGSRNPYINCNAEATVLLIGKLAEIPLGSEPLDWIKTMLVQDRHLRPTAAQVFASITERHGYRASSTAFCGICCLDTEDSDSHDSLYEEFSPKSSGIETVVPIRRSDGVDDIEQILRLTDIFSSNSPEFTNVLANETESGIESTAFQMEEDSASPLISTEVTPGDAAVEQSSTSSVVMHSESSLGAEIPLITEPRYKQNITPPETRSNGVFGVALATSIKYANVPNTISNEGGSISGYIPIVVGRCGLFLKEHGLEVEGVLMTPGHPERVARLIKAFNSPDRYGKGLNWTGYSVHDAAEILLLYLQSLPEPVIPFEWFTAFQTPHTELPAILQSLKTFKEWGQEPLETWVEKVVDLDLYGVIKEYRLLIRRIPIPSKQLLLYLLDILAVFASPEYVNKATSAALASKFQYSILRSRNETNHFTNSAETEYNKDILIFLIENQDYFESFSHSSKKALPRTPKSISNESTSAANSAFQEVTGGNENQSSISGEFLMERAKPSMYMETMPHTLPLDSPSTESAVSISSSALTRLSLNSTEGPSLESIIESLFRSYRNGNYHAFLAEHPTCRVYDVEFYQRRSLMTPMLRTLVLSSTNMYIIPALSQRDLAATNDQGAIKWLKKNTKSLDFARMELSDVKWDLQDAKEFWIHTLAQNKVFVYMKWLVFKVAGGLTDAVKVVQEIKERIALNIRPRLIAT